ncbi:hypothetical protein HY256_05610, partial [Candidatus Sumerlaeota bacterium]|nr:hypothetical protein [Candidatus Sumerlaeota bacterium]
MRTRPNSHLEVIRQIRRLLWLLPICSLSMPACRKDAEKPRSEPPKGSQAVETAALAKLQQRSKSTEPQAAADKPKLDNLRALPYLDFVKHDAGSENQSGVTYRDKSIRFWRQQPGQHWANCLLLENGDLLAVGADPRPEGTGFDTGFADESRYLLRMNWEGILLWKKPVNAHHDIEPAPAGQFVTMTFERRAIPAISNDTESRDDQITLIDGGGNVVQSLSLYDLLSNRPDLFTFQNVSPQL